ncbi:hypothetical protein PENSPDRAFT_546907, partial [Peniophora sp. CONT]
YLVRWKGYDKGHDSWEPLANVANAEKKVADFHKRHPEAPRKISAAIFNAIQWKPLENLTEGTSSPYSWTDGR